MKNLIPINLPEKVIHSFHLKHPWLFRNNIKQECSDLKDGDFVVFINNKNEAKGVGIYSKEGLIAIRIIHFGNSFNLDIIKSNIKSAIRKREYLLKDTNSLRWIHGENDGFPGLTIDQHGNTLVVMAYSSSLYSYARYISNVLYIELKKNIKLNSKPTSIVIKSPTRLGNSLKSKNSIRVLRGNLNETNEIKFRSIHYQINIQAQKGGIYNDIRNLRNYILDNPSFFKNKKVLNLFSNNGLLSICFDKVGASKIVSVDSSKIAIELHKMNILENSNIHILVVEDIFKNLKVLLEKWNEKFDVIVIDPPSLTASEQDKKSARTAYKKLFSHSLKHLNQNGTMILCSCSSRIHSNDFERISKESFDESNIKYPKPIKLKNEIDHPIIETFPEGDYFKVHIYHSLQFNE